MFNDGKPEMYGVFLFSVSFFSDNITLSLMRNLILE